MCGLLGIVAPPGGRPGVSASVAASMRDTMTQRGPDDAGLVEHRNVLFAHRRLKVIDLVAGQQPMWSPDRRYLLIYNGELYNDAELRTALSREQGIVFQTSCDTETLLQALIAWGEEALERLRGMFAFACYDFVENRLLLARDPLGIKPLYYATIGREVVVSSQPTAILGHPSLVAEPDLAVVSAYLSTIRTTLGRRTLFEHVRTVLPGEAVRVRFDTGAPQLDFRAYWNESSQPQVAMSFEEATHLVRERVIESVRSHLRSDVPRCLLLSGGLDSAIIATVCRELGADDIMQTWCAADAGDCGGDRRFAVAVAQHLGARHHEAIVEAHSFRQTWLELIRANGVPLSTPNETAIHIVARALHPHATVALSGEGADELFGGYALPMLCGLDAVQVRQPRGTWPGAEQAHRRYVAELEAQYGTATLGTDLEHYLRTSCWIHPERKSALVSDAMTHVTQGDHVLLGELATEFAREEESQSDPRQRWLNVQRRINLSGLLSRLDTSTMAASVEGRTPMADVRLAELAAALPFEFKFKARAAEDGGWSSAAQCLARGGVESKRVLRAAFAREIPLEVLQRPKASFPLPFQQWLAPMAKRIEGSSAVGSLFRREVVSGLCADPESNWLALWPVANIVLWFEHFWGEGLSGETEASAVEVSASRERSALSEVG